MTGFIGLGIMGKPMAKHLLQALGELAVYDLQGRCHHRGTSLGNTVITLPQAGAYLLTIEGIGTRKIVAL